MTRLITGHLVVPETAAFLVQLTHSLGLVVLLLASSARSQAKDALTLEGDEIKSVQHLAFSPDGKTLAISSVDLVTLWEVESGKKLKTTFDRLQGSFSLTFSPDGKLLVASSTTRTCVFEVATGKMKHLIKFDESDAVGGMAISPDGKILALAGKAHAATFIDLENYKELAKLEGQNDIRALAFDKAGDTLATASRHGTTVIWDVKKREKLKTLDQSKISGIGSMAYSADGKTVVTDGSFQGTNFLRAWDVEKGEPRWTFENPKKGVQLLNGVRSLALSPDGKMLVFTTAGGFVRFIADLDNGGPIETAEDLRVPDSGPYPVAFSPDGKLIAVGAHKMVKMGAVPEKKKE